MQLTLRYSFVNGHICHCRLAGAGVDGPSFCISIPDTLDTAKSGFFGRSVPDFLARDVPAHDAIAPGKGFQVPDCPARVFAAIEPAAPRPAPAYLPRLRIIARSCRSSVERIRQLLMFAFALFVGEGRPLLHVAGVGPGDVRALPESQE